MSGLPVLVVEASLTIPLCSIYIYIYSLSQFFIENTLANAIFDSMGTGAAAAESQDAGEMALLALGAGATL